MDLNHPKFGGVCRVSIVLSIRFCYIAGAGLAEAPGGEIDSWSSLARSAQGGSAAIYGGHWFSSVQHGRATAFGRQRGWAMAPFIGVRIILLVLNVGNGWEWMGMVEWDCY